MKSSKKLSPKEINGLKEQYQRSVLTLKQIDERFVDLAKLKAQVIRAMAMIEEVLDCEQKQRKDLENVS